MRRKNYGIKIIGKAKTVGGDQFAVIKTKKGYYPRVKGKNLLVIGDRHRTAEKARKELSQWIQAKKDFMKTPMYKKYKR